MADLQVTFLRDVLPLEGTNLVSLTPPILGVRGRRLDEANDVRINGRSVSFFVSTPQLILAGLPENMAAAEIHTVDVLTDNFTNTERSRLEFLLATRPTTVSGIQRLVQIFLKTLFTTPGTNIYSKDQGGGALRILGMVDGAEATKVTMAFAAAVDRTRTQIMRHQSSNSVPTTERLLDATILRSAFSPQSAALTATLLFTSFAREQAKADIDL